MTGQRFSSELISRLAGFLVLAGIVASMVFGGWLADVAMAVSLTGFLVFVFMQRRL